jgi:hypothetical protein
VLVARGWRVSCDLQDSWEGWTGKVLGTGLWKLRRLRCRLKEVIQE